jgi:hypothetical protein
MQQREVRTALTKLLVSSIVLFGLVILCFADIDRAIRGFLIVFIAILAFPITLLYAIDASKVIRRAAPDHKSLTIFGRILAFPQAIMGIVLIAFSVVYPIFGVHELIVDISNGHAAALPIVRLVIAVLSFLLGLRYVREGLGIEKKGQ